MAVSTATMTMDESTATMTMDESTATLTMDESSATMTMDDSTVASTFMAAVSLTSNLTSTMPSPGATLKDELKFHWADYAVFIASLVLTAAIGLGFALVGRCRKNNTEEYLMASRSMNAVPVSLSLLGSLFNAVFILGGPADVYFFGLEGMWIAVSFLFLAPVVAHLVIPTFYRMKLTSAYEYLEKRFHYAVRVLGSIVFAISLVLFLAIVLYAPALAFSQVSGLSLGVSIGVTGAICAVYTALGGMKAVIWTDTIQMVILFAGMAVLAFKGIMDAGGFEFVWEINVRNGRVNWADHWKNILDPHPHHRHTFWGQVVGQWFVYLGIMMSNQMMIQRYLTVTNLRQAQATIYLMILFSIVTTNLIMLVGIGMYATYAACDPLIRQRIKSGDQIVAIYLMDVLGQYHGLPGLFVAAVFAAALSSVSSAVNSLACISLEDYIKPAYRAIKRVELPEKQAVIITMVLALFFGAATIGLSFVAEEMTKNLIEAIPTIWSLVGGPIAGVFILGLLCPFANTFGALAGLLVSLGLGVWLGVGGILHVDPPMPLNLGGFCLPPEIIAILTDPTFQPPTKKPASDALMKFYKISYAWYGLFTMLTCIITGILVSLLTRLVASLLTANGKPPPHSESFVALSLSKPPDEDIACTFALCGSTKCQDDVYILETNERRDDVHIIETEELVVIQGDDNRNGNTNQAYVTSVEVTTEPPSYSEVNN